MKIKHLPLSLLFLLLFLGGVLFGCDDDDLPALDAGARDLTAGQDQGGRPVDGAKTPDQLVGPPCQKTADCAADHYCEFGKGCGSGAPGVCLPRPTGGCPKNINPVCGCDGMTHDNACVANRAGASVAYMGECGKKKCSTDDDCMAMGWWCHGGICLECSNSGLSCDLACPGGAGEAWELYQRNGCSPCECAPTNECVTDADCGSGQKCYAGAMCWDWCPADDPSCCFGNRCSAEGCAGEAPAGCWSRGCPLGQVCEDSGCTSTSCGCDGGAWICTSDCGGGSCGP